MKIWITEVQISDFLLCTLVIRELSVAGNKLECDGMNELLRPVVTLCEASQPPQTLPPLAKLFLQDNCIDTQGTCGGMFAPIICVRTLKRLDI